MPKKGDPGARKLKPVTEDELSDDGLVALLDAEGDPFQTLIAAARATGMSSSVCKGLIKRLRAQYQPVVRELKKINTGELVDMLTQKAHMALEYLDEYAMSQASAKDIAIVIGIVLEKRNLLRGEPTQIISSTDRKGLDELGRELAKEIQRRGMTIDVTPDRVTVSQDQAMASRPVSPGGIQDQKLRKRHEEAEKIGEPL